MLAASGSDSDHFGKPQWAHFLTGRNHRPPPKGRPHRGQGQKTYLAIATAQTIIQAPTIIEASRELFENHSDKNARPATGGRTAEMTRTDRRMLRNSSQQPAYSLEMSEFITIPTTKGPRRRPKTCRIDASSCCPGHRQRIKSFQYDQGRDHPVEQVNSAARCPRPFRLGRPRAISRKITRSTQQGPNRPQHKNQPRDHEHRPK